MNNDFEYRNSIRDKHLRRKVIWLLHLTMKTNKHIGGWASGAFLVENINAVLAADQGFADEGHAIQFLSEMVSFGLIEERDDRQRLTLPITLKTLMYKLSPEGVALVTETRGPHPAVEDDRPS